MHRRDRREFDAFVCAVGDRLLHTAELLTGDPGRAERRVNRALARTYLKWRHSVEPDPTRIAHRALVAGYLDPWRPLPWRPQPIWRRPGGDEAERARDEVLRGLDRLTRLERAVTVLRAYAQLDEFDTADALALRESAVRSAYGRAVARLAAAESPVESAAGFDAAPARRNSRDTVTWTAGVGVTYGPDAGDGTAGTPGVSRPVGGAAAKRWPAVSGDA